MDFRRLFDIFSFQQARYPQNTALAYPQAHDRWQKYSTDACLAEIDRVSAALLDLNAQVGDRIALLFEHSHPYWNFLDFGSLQLGLVVVPIHASTGSQELKHIFSNAEIRFCVCSHSQLYDKVAAIKGELPLFEHLFCLDIDAGQPSWTTLSHSPDADHLATITDRKHAIDEHDLATIIYTSGASGVPKGVMLSHYNIVSNIKATITLVPVDCDKRVVSFLPMSHIFERMVVFTYIAAGASIHYIDQLDQAVTYFQKVKPHYFTSVPRLLERMYDGILLRANELSGLQRRIVLWAIRLGERYHTRKRPSIRYGLKLWVANWLVYRRWRRLLGGKVEGVVVGAAALDPKLGRLFSAAGIDIREGYGLTETSPVIAFNRFEPGGVRFGTVGIPIPGIELRIDSPNEEGSGEIVVRGPGIMQGYCQQPDLTSKVLDDQGWFHTGDVGKMVHKRFLTITDRKKDIFKTSSGKYVAPQVLENTCNSSPYILQSMIVGFQRPFVTALIVPNFPQLKQWCHREGIHWTAPAYMVHNNRVEAFYEQLIAELNEQWESVQKIRSFLLLPDEWGVENGGLTPNLKLRRPYLMEKFSKEIDSLYL